MHPDQFGPVSETSPAADAAGEVVDLEDSEKLLIEAAADLEELSLRLAATEEALTVALTPRGSTSSIVELLTEAKTQLEAERNQSAEGRHFSIAITAIEDAMLRTNLGFTLKRGVGNPNQDVQKGVR